MDKNQLEIELAQLVAGFFVRANLKQEDFDRLNIILTKLQTLRKHEEDIANG